MFFWTIYFHNHSIQSPSLAHQQHSSADFLYIVGAFNNVIVDAVIGTLSKIGVDGSSVCYIIM